MVPVLAALSACNVVTTGERGAVTFTPDECGEAACNLDRELAAGASVDVTLGSSHYDVSRLAVVSNDTRVAVVVPIADAFGWSWRVIGAGAGAVRLSVLDPAGYEVGATSIEVRYAESLGLVLRYGPAVGPGFYAETESWQMPAGNEVSFALRPFDSHGFEMMGKLDLSAEADAPVMDALDPAARLTEGELALFPTLRGDYGITFYDRTGLVADIAFHVW